MFSFSYIAALLGFLVLFYNPLTQYLTGNCNNNNNLEREPRRLPRTPRPPVNESLIAADDFDMGLGMNGTGVKCEPDAYSVHIVSRAPLVVYIENFLSEGERRHLLDISEPIFEPSTITNDGRKTQRDTSVRDSEVAVVPRTDAVRCIEARARAFQGWREDLWLERLRTQRYGPNQHYSHHFDWGSGARGWGRFSSFMVWVHAEDLEGGGTEFPRLDRGAAPDRRLCRFIECDGDDDDDDRKQSPGSASSPPSDVGAGEDADAKSEKGKKKKKKNKKKSDKVGMGKDDNNDRKGKDWERGEERDNDHNGKGITFKAIPGNAVYWENFRPDGTGRGWQETWHAGLPVKKGTKVGLNIWSSGRLT